MNGLCNCTNPVVTYNSQCKKSNCIRIPHIYVKQIDSIYPCNQTLIIDISNKISFDPNQLKSITDFFVLSHTPNLKDVSFLVSPDRTSVEIQLTSNYSGYPAPDYKFGTISWKARQGALSDIATVTVPFKSHCNTIEIPNDKYCDPCNGALIDNLVNISVVQQDSDSSVNISVT